jgi:hypothetical protein
MEQMQRAERYLQRIQEIYEGCPQKYDEVLFYEDDVISFFIHCHHISDWIIELNKWDETKQAINKYINKHKELVICADLCNVQKHCELKRVRGDRAPHIVSAQCSTTAYGSEPKKLGTFKAKYQILADNQIYDVLELAEKCMGLWQDYTKINGVRLN